MADEVLSNIPIKNIGDYFTKDEMNSIVTQIRSNAKDISGAIGGFQGSVNPTYNFIGRPKGIYKPIQNGVYGNPTTGSVSVDLSLGVWYLNFDGTTLTGDYTAVQLEGYATIEDVDNVLVETKEIAAKPKPDNLLLTNKQETEITLNTIPEPNDGFSMGWGSVNPAVTSGIGSSLDTLDAIKIVSGLPVPIFNYRGNCFVFNMSTVTNNFQGYIYFKINQLLRPPKSNIIYFKLELASDNPVTASTIRGYRSSTTAIDTDGTKNNNFSINNIPKVVTITIDTNLITQNPKENEWIGMRLFIVSGGSSAGNIYVGRIVVSDDADCDINTPSANSLRLQEGKKFGIWGDSIVRQMRIDPKGIRRMGGYFSTTEISVGRNGHQPTAIGGTRIMPYSDFTPGQSIYERISEAVTFYRGDIDILRGGANDPRAEYISANLWIPNLILGQVSDPSYTGISFPTQAAYLAYWSGIRDGALRDSGNISDFTFASVYKGCLQKLINARPNGKVFSMTVFIPSGGQSYQDNVWNPMWDLVVQISSSMGIKCIDARSESGINLLNESVYYGESDKVHPNNEAGKRIAEVEVRYIGDVEKTL